MLCLKARTPRHEPLRRIARFASPTSPAATTSCAFSRTIFARWKIPTAATPSPRSPGHFRSTRKTRLIRDLIAARTDPVLFALSYDYVGDLSETVALMWPKTPPPPPAQRRGGVGGGGCAAITEAAYPADRPPTPDPLPTIRFARGGEGSKLSLATTTLTTTTLHRLPRRGRDHASHARQDRAAKQLTRWLDELDETGRWALLKLVTGAMRIGISARLAKTAAAELGGKDPPRNRIDMAGAHPTLSRSVRVAGGPRRKTGQSRSPAPFRPVMLAQCDRGCRLCKSRRRRFHRGMEMGRHSRAGGERSRRARQHAGALYSRSGEDITKSFPDFCRHCICKILQIWSMMLPENRFTLGSMLHSPSTASCWWFAMARANLQRPAATHEPQGRVAEVDEGLSDPSARL